MPGLLRNLDIIERSDVDRAANKQTYLSFKSKDKGENMNLEQIIKYLVEGKLKNETEVRKSLTEKLGADKVEQAVAIGKIFDGLDAKDVTSMLKELGVEIEQPAPAPEPEPQPEENTELPEEAKKHFKSLQEKAEQAEKAAKEATEKAAKLEKELKLKDFKSKAEALNVQGDKDALAKFMLDVEEKLPDHKKFFEELLKSSSEINKTSPLFKEQGTSPGDSGEEAKRKARADELRKSDPSMTHEQAMRKAWLESND